ncbi:2,3-dihydro-2,3-dihydroxybenzoate dehydrogenase [Actinoplanes utahensis]|uniref:2,3-dihydro-2,3-dihydroxybenzoate dehydrogenase n=1 Tax=Actinoplanes utahensis TaxID=1869 RepID=A0A0A6UN65_ACTUT|nr:2,3-dihydro-2,3-dihydroxybenzoate dehydrogenase [Actinoplanes utahensis]KHD76836.1 2,3-dihydroxybenzoate-2,3-dehydrogenase [Actinoplanes utahensis]GIF33423.1 2,3-dihydro-2,3-dihydroxybenzoate dehydrogenase [Actinoplanes utahensis]
MEDRTALVTGAAGGIGAATARALAAEGIRVAAVDVAEDRLAAEAARLRAGGLPVTAFPADVTDAGRVEATVAAVEHELGPIGLLVNAAGVLRTGPALDLGDADWSSTFAVNTTGVMHVSRAVVSRMVPRRRGAVVTVASNAGFVARQGMAAYGASKAAAIMFTKSLALEVARYGIRCNVVAPGSTDTPMLRGMWAGGDGASVTIGGDPDAYKVGIPLRKIADPSDIADAVVFLLSDRAGHITMHDLTVDGGATLGA